VEPAQIDQLAPGPSLGDAPPAAGPPVPAATDAPAEATRLARALVANVTGVVRGQAQAVELTVTAVLAGGHVLVEDVPGTGKTTLARAVAASLGQSFARVQSTADLMPADVTGSSMWNPAQGTFTFVPGPVFSSVLLVDELNRMPPRSQSALLEAMEERQVTVDGSTYPLPDPFVVVATQNPVEQHGTYPLPEGTLDRFAVRVELAPLSLGDEVDVVREQLRAATVESLTAVTDPATLRATMKTVRDVHVDPAVMAYAVALARATRDHAKVRLGAGTRAALTLVRCAQARAVLQGRGFVTPDDVKTLAVHVLAHRVQSTDSHGAGSRTVALTAEAVASVPVPVPLGEATRTHDARRPV
jgi:MoxR-like ATPase